MRFLTFVGLIVVCLSGLELQAQADEPRKNSLQGVWQAQSMKADGKPAPAEAVKRMRFRFQGKKLFVRGNSKDDKELECTYTIDPKKSPRHLDFTLPMEKKTILAIYELKDDTLKVCARHASSSKGRPTEFVSTPESRLVLIVFKRKKQ